MHRVKMKTLDAGTLRKLKCDWCNRWCCKTKRGFILSGGQKGHCGVKNPSHLVAKLVSFTAHHLASVLCVKVLSKFFFLEKCKVKVLTSWQITLQVWGNNHGGQSAGENCLVKGVNEYEEIYDKLKVQRVKRQTPSNKHLLIDCLHVGKRGKNSCKYLKGVLVNGLDGILK